MEEANLKQSKSSQGIGKEGWQGIFISVVVIAIVLWLFGFNFWQVSEGYVDTSDCRNTIILQQGDWQTYFGRFICDYYRNTDDTIKSGTCTKIKTKGGKCDTEYYYDYEP